MTERERYEFAQGRHIGERLTPDAHFRWLERLADPRSTDAMRGLAMKTLLEDRKLLLQSLCR